MKRFAAFALLCALSCSQALAGEGETQERREIPPTTDFEMERIGQPTAENIVVIEPISPFKMFIIVFCVGVAALIAAELTSTGKETTHG